MSPPRTIPPDLLDRYSMGGKAAIHDEYFDDTHSGGELHYSHAEIMSHFVKIHHRGVGYYRETDVWLYDVLDHHPIRGKSCVIMGSQTSWYESIALYYGASSCTTVEYQPRTTDHPHLSFLTPDELKARRPRFDAAFSISSFEHDGLGRYGDPLDPDADLQAMRSMKDYLNPGGLLYFTVPIGTDKVVWNAHRVYGEHRLPMLLEGWKIVGLSGFFPQMILHPNFAQPMFVLRSE